jgi:UDP-N-acetylglucosamine 4,6-dehydratase
MGLMKGGEVFIPKIPSMKITDLARAIAPDCEHDVVGVRPGEKLHETMVPQEEAINTLEYDDFYIIRPSFHWWDYPDEAQYGSTQGKPVAEDFEYRSDTNPQWLDLEGLRRVIE